MRRAPLKGGDVKHLVQRSAELARITLRPRLALIVCLLLIVVPPAVTAAATSHQLTTQQTYWGPNTTADGWIGHWAGLAVPRSYNNMWHQCGLYQNNSFGSVVEYTTTDGTATAVDQDGYNACRNPVHLGATSNNREVVCAGNGPVYNVTCQTTRP